MEKIIDEKKQGEALVLEPQSTNTKKLFIESYGCQMNFSDSEIVASILSEQGYNTTQSLEDADLVLVNTCSIRDKAEQTVRKRLEKYNAVKKVNHPCSCKVSKSRGTLSIEAGKIPPEAPPGRYALKVWLSCIPPQYSSINCFIVIPAGANLTPGFLTLPDTEKVLNPFLLLRP